MAIYASEAVLWRPPPPVPAATAVVPAAASTSSSSNWFSRRTAVTFVAGVVLGGVLSFRLQTQGAPPPGARIKLQVGRPPMASGRPPPKINPKDIDSRKKVAVLHMRGVFQAATQKQPWDAGKPSINGEQVEKELHAVYTWYQKMKEEQALKKTTKKRRDGSKRTEENDQETKDDDDNDCPLAAIVIRMNSPGGSPLEASKIYTTIKHYKNKHPEVPIVVHVEGLCASAGYYASVAADEIVVDPNSIVGSIGVISGSRFFVSKLLEKVGIEAKMVTSGAHKSRFNMFEDPDERDFIFYKSLMGDTHQQFIDVVKKERKDRLKPKVAAQALAKMNGTKEEDEDGLFDGCFYLGTKAVDVGLADTLSSLPLSLFLAERYGEDFMILTVEGRKSGLGTLLSKFQTEGGVMDVLARVGGGGGGSVVDDVYRLGTDVALWSKYGMLPPR